MAVSVPGVKLASGTSDDITSLKFNVDPVPCWPDESAVSVLFTRNLFVDWLFNTVPNRVVELLVSPANERLKFKAQLFHLVLYTYLPLVESKVLKSVSWASSVLLLVTSP